MLRTDLRGANLHAAKLQGADLCDVDLSETSVAAAEYNDDTKLPDGFDSEAAGAINEFCDAFLGSDKSP